MGIIAIIYPEVLGTGYGWTQIAIYGDIVKMSIILMMVLVLAKILTTSFTIGSGGMYLLAN